MKVVHAGKLSCMKVVHAGEGNLTWDRSTHTVPEFQNQLFVRKWAADSSELSKEQTMLLWLPVKSGFIKIGKIPIQGTQTAFRAQIED